MAHQWNHDFAGLARESGFHFHNDTINSFDWKNIGTLDVDCVIQNRDFERLDGIIPCLAEAPLGNILLQNNILDPSIGKYFRLAQLGIQYLLFCKRFMDKTVCTLRASSQESKREVLRLEKQLKRRNEEIASLQKVVQRLEHSQQIVYSCTFCSKNFISNDLLTDHIKRKHCDEQWHNKNESKCAGNDANLINAIKLELEVKQLKERLNLTEKDLLEQKHRCNSCREVMQFEIKGKTKMRSDAGIQTNLEDDRDTNRKDEEKKDCCPNKKDVQLISKIEVGELLQQQVKMFDVWKSEEQHRHDTEISELKKSFHKALERLEAMKKRSESNIAVQTSSPPVPIARTEKEIWRVRFQELEEVYRENQHKMQISLEEMEKKYSEKLSQLDDVVEKLKPSLQPTRLEEQSFKKNLKVSEKSFTQATQKNNCANLIEKNVRKISLNGGINDKMKKILDKKQLAKVKTCPLAEASKKANSMLNSRLKALGINSDNIFVKRAALVSIHDNLAEQREKSQQKFRSFFVIRNQLAAKLNKMARIRMVQRNEDASENLPVHQSKLEVKNLHIEQKKESPNTRKNDMSDCLPLTLSAKLSDYTLHSDVERILQSSIHHPSENVASTLTNLKPLPAPRKRVNFHLESKIDEKKEVASTLRNSDDSDWNISSFADDF